MSGAGTILYQPYKPYDEIALSSLIINTIPGGNLRKNINNVDYYYYIQELKKSGNKITQDELSSIILNTTIGKFGANLYYGDSGATTPPTPERQNEMRDARNQIQGMLLVASANRCNAFKLLLRERSTTINFGLGSLATMLGAAGAIVSGGASQALSGAAAAASGTNAEYNRDILSSVTSSVIIPGIDKERSSLFQEIANRRCLGVSSYTLTQALTDAIRYHSACSTDVGVAAASSALSKSESTHTSLAEANDTVMAIKTLHDSLSKISSSKVGGSPKPKKDPNKKTNSPDIEPAPNSTHTTNNSMLVGDSVNFLQCPSLDKDGILDKTASQHTAGETTGPGQIQYGIQ